jgi:hypothetical protein
MAPWLFGLEHVRWKLALADGVPSPHLIALYHDVGLLVSMAVAVVIAALLTSPLWLIDPGGAGARLGGTGSPPDSTAGMSRSSVAC